MRTIIHDLNKKDIKKLKFNKDDKIIDALSCKNSCVGCFSCWIKHPKNCIYKDNYSNITNFLKESDELIIISKSRYGCYNSQIKRVLERCIGYVLPYFIIRNNEIHHEARYEKQIKLKAYFYGNITKEEKKCLIKLVKANSINLNAKDYSVYFSKNIKEMTNVYFN